MKLIAVCTPIPTLRHTLTHTLTRSLLLLLRSAFYFLNKSFICLIVQFYLASIEDNSVCFFNLFDFACVMSEEFSSCFLGKYCKGSLS